jgi:AcrR family transcriptional regulator
MARTLDVAKRTAILTAAKSIFIKDGYATAKMSDIATEVGVAPGTLYLYFESKEALANAIGEELFARLMEEFNTIISNIEAPDDLNSLVDYAARIAFEEREVLAMVRERSHDKKKNPLVRQRLLDKLTEALSLLIDKGIIRRYSDRKVLAEMVLSVIRRLLMAHAVFADQNTDALRAGAVEMLQHCLFDDVTVVASEIVKRKQHQ